METIALNYFGGGFFVSDRKNYLFQPFADCFGKFLYHLVPRWPPDQF